MTEQDLDAVLNAAEQASQPLAELRPAQRAELLRGVADALDAAAGELIPLAQQESHLPEPRLRGELVRTTFQLRLFAEVLEEGSYLAVTVDTPDDGWPTGPRPDLRRVLLPLGPAVVFAASNFPFAFSVAGGDTASALAAGCPVVLKAHPGHPELSQRTGEIVRTALRAQDAPSGTFALISGDATGRAALGDPRVRAGAFTGSQHTGRLLFDLASSRPEPIPFYAEMGSVNPAFVTARAAAERPNEIAEGFLNSFALGVGQFCTKPGFLFVPEEAVATFEEALVSAVDACEAAPMLNERIARGFHSGLQELAGHPAIRVLAEGQYGATGVSPSLLRTTVKELRENRESLVAECFGPVSLLVSYSSEDELLAACRLFAGELTATVQGQDGEPIVSALYRELAQRAGRLVWNGWPTGVSVSYAMQHGGPYPATTSVTTTSVGTASIQRFLRPVCFQNAPAVALPEAVRDGNPLRVPRRVNGRLELPEQAT